jgi:hypothetical protein
VATGEKQPDVLQGTLDLMVLKTLEAMGRCTQSDATTISNAKDSC